MVTEIELFESTVTHSRFAHMLQSALRLMAGFLNIYCELYQICDFCVTNLSFKH